jgi:hypothetical protein
LAETVGDVQPVGRHVASFLPPGFDAYARLLHPPYRRGRKRRLAVRWRDIARAGALNVGPETTWKQIAQATDEPGSIEEPTEGSLPAAERAVLVDLLRFHTKSVRCWFAVWEGYAGLVPQLQDAARFDLRKLTYLLLSGPIGSANLSLVMSPAEQGPNIWWPDERSWCVMSDIDLTSTYVGGSRECIGSIVADYRLDAIALSGSDPVPFI